MAGEVLLYAITCEKPALTETRATEPSCQPSPGHQHKIFRPTSCVGPSVAAASIEKPFGGDGRAGNGEAETCGGRGTAMPRAVSKSRSASSQLVRCSTGSHVSPDTSLPAHRTKYWGLP